MKKDDITRWATQCKMPYDYVTGEIVQVEKLERFAELVAADERQAIGEDIMAFYRGLVEKGDPARLKVEHCLNLIRLRAKS